MSQGWKVAIAVSLALNLFLVGAMAGVLIVGARMLGDRQDFRRGRGGDVGAAFQALPPERRQALRAVMRAQALDAAPDLRAAGAARREASQLIAAPTYDATAVAAALTRARDADARARARIDATLASRLAEFSPQERAVFARVMMRGPDGRGGRGRRGGPGGPDRDGRDDRGPPPPPAPPPEPPARP